MIFDYFHVTNRQFSPQMPRYKLTIQTKTQWIQLYIYVFIRPTTSHPRDAYRPGNTEQIHLNVYRLHKGSLHRRVLM